MIEYVLELDLTPARKAVSRLKIAIDVLTGKISPALAEILNSVNDDYIGKTS